MKKIKTYEDALEFIFSKLPIFQRQGPKALKYDLSNIQKFSNLIGNPHKNFKSIHIAGTNGKGTTSHVLASVFQEAGYKTGLYTSPHYKDFRERIKIDGKYISKSYLKSFIQKYKDHIEELKPSYFELSVALAFSYFADMEIDIAIIEVGLGGRLDSTNIITPLASLITNISYDHTNTLGNSLAEIAKEKAGIIKKGIPVLIGEKQKECNKVFTDIAQASGSKIYFADDILSIRKIKSNLYCTKFEIDSEKLKLDSIKTDLTGPFSEKNIKYSLAFFNIFKKHYPEFDIKTENILKGLRHIKKTTKYIGRWYIISKSPLIIADGAHNIGAIKDTMSYLSGIQFDNLHIILGIVSDKEWDEIFKLLPKNAKYYFTKANIPRAMDESGLKEMARQYNLIGKSYKNVELAKQKAISNSSANDLILIIGSIYLVGEVL